MSCLHLCIAVFLFTQVRPAITLFTQLGHPAMSRVDMQQKQWNMRVTIVIGALGMISKDWTNWKSKKELRPSRLQYCWYRLWYSEKSRRPEVTCCTQTSVKGYQLELVRKTCKVLNNIRHKRNIRVSMTGWERWSTGKR